MKLICMVLAAVLTAGCTTISNVGKMNRIMPQVEHLILLKDKAIVFGENESMLVCGPDEYEKKLMVSIAKQMGWTVIRYSNKVNPDCAEVEVRP